MDRKGVGRLVLLVLVTLAVVMAGCSHGDDGSDGDGGGPYVDAPSTIVEDAATPYPQADEEVEYPGTRR